MFHKLLAFPQTNLKNLIKLVKIVVFIRFLFDEKTNINILNILIKTNRLIYFKLFKIYDRQDWKFLFSLQFCRFLKILILKLTFEANA